MSHGTLYPRDRAGKWPASGSSGQYAERSDDGYVGTQHISKSVVEHVYPVDVDGPLDTDPETPAKRAGLRDGNDGAIVGPEPR